MEIQSCIYQKTFFKIQKESMIGTEMDDHLNLLFPLSIKTQIRLKRLRTILP